MRERTVVVSSLGKRYSCTGWKIGWACAPDSMTAAIQCGPPVPGVLRARAPATCRAPRVVQVGRSMGAGPSCNLPASKKPACSMACAPRDFAREPRKGSYFILAETGDHDHDVDDVAFCERMISDARVAAIPASIFTHQGSGCRSHVRFAFCKAERDLTEAIARITRMKPGL